MAERHVEKKDKTDGCICNDDTNRTNNIGKKIATDVQQQIKNNNIIYLISFTIMIRFYRLWTGRVELIEIRKGRNRRRGCGVVRSHLPKSGSTDGIII
jgi:hypothetical protein